MAELERKNGDSEPVNDVISITVSFSPSRGEIFVSGCVDMAPFALGLLESGLQLVKERWMKARLVAAAHDGPRIVPGVPRC